MKPAGLLEDGAGQRAQEKELVKKGGARPWTLEQAEWCCLHEGVGCTTSSTTTRPLYNCALNSNGGVRLWSYGKRDYCCRHHDRGCKQKGETSSASTSIE